MPGIQQEATQLLGQIPFGAIIAGPLMAAVTAQGYASQACVDFITKVGLDNGKVRTVVFKFTKAIPQTQAELERKARAMVNPAPADGAPLNEEQQKALPALLAKASSEPTLVDATIGAPLLSILPIPFIRIDNLTINGAIDRSRRARGVVLYPAHTGAAAAEHLAASGRFDRAHAGSVGF